MTTKTELILDLESMEDYLDMTGYEEQFNLVPKDLEIGDILLWPLQMAVIEASGADWAGVDMTMLSFRVKIMFITPPHSEVFVYLYLRIPRHGRLRLKPAEDLKGKIRVFRKMD